MTVSMLALLSASVPFVNALDHLPELQTETTKVGAEISRIGIAPVELSALGQPDPEKRLQGIRLNDTDQMVTLLDGHEVFQEIRERFRR